jgi:hypothetical protein
VLNLREGQGSLAGRKVVQQLGAPSSQAAAGRDVANSATYQRAVEQDVVAAGCSLSAELSEATGPSAPSVLLSGLREHVPLCLADNRDRITAPLLSEQEQIGDQVDDLTDGSTILPASVSALGTKLGVECSLSETRSAGFCGHEAAPRQRVLVNGVPRHAVRRHATFIDQISGAVENALPGGLPAPDRDLRPALIRTAARHNPCLDEPQHRLGLQLLRRDAELACEFVRVDDPIAMGIATETHWYALH